jgi:hypothetical protein
MKNLQEIKKLRTNADAIYSLFNQKIPLWRSNPGRYDKTGWGFNEDSRFNACRPASVAFSSHRGVYGDSGCSSQLSLDDALFQQHLVEYLNKNKEAVMLAIAKSIEEEAKTLKSAAEEELKSQLLQLAELDKV